MVDILLGRMVGDTVDFLRDDIVGLLLESWWVTWMDVWLLMGVSVSNKIGFLVGEIW